jgi:hypothetical protein
MVESRVSGDIGNLGIIRAGMRRENRSLRPGLLTHDPHCFRAAQSRHLNVEDHQPGLEGWSYLQRRRAAVRKPHFAAERFEQLAERFGAVMVVVHRSSRHIKA